MIVLPRSYHIEIACNKNSPGDCAHMPDFLKVSKLQLWGQYTLEKIKHVIHGYTGCNTLWKPRHITWFLM